MLLLCFDGLNNEYEYDVAIIATMITPRKYERLKQEKCFLSSRKRNDPSWK